MQTVFGECPRTTRGSTAASSTWLRSELAAVRPEVLVLLGATAGKALLGSGFKLGEARGASLESDLAPVVDRDRASVRDPADARP